MSSSEDRDIEPFDWFNKFFGRVEGAGEEDLVFLIFSEALTK